MADIDPHIVERFRDHMKARAARVQEIEEGALPTLQELLTGHPWRKRDVLADIRSWARVCLRTIPKDAQESIREGLLAIRDQPDAETVAAVSDEMKKHEIMRLHDLEDRGRLSLYHAALTRDPTEVVPMVARTVSHGHYGDDVAWMGSVRLLLSLYESPIALTKLDVDDGDEVIRKIIRKQAYLAAAAEKPAKEEKPKEPLAEIYEDLDAVLEDRAEIKKAGDFLVPKGRGLQVLGKLDDTGNSDRRQVKRGFASIAGKRLRLVQRGDVAAHRASLASRWPHALEVIDLILGDLAAAEPVRLRPTLIVGRPGSGKTRLARDIAETVGLPVMEYAAGGMTDASFGGTSAQWSTARPSVPLELIRQSKTANPLVIIDEIEKASSSRHNGSFADVLLGFLEPSQARARHDLALEVDCNLSAVSYVATANSLEGIPWPIRDRMRTIEMPEPTWQHVGDLIPSILADIARERNLHPGWLTPLAQDELEVVRRAWPGGSIRRLRRAITVILDGRDRLLGRA